jgi:hypothetical protein
MQEGIQIHESRLAKKRVQRFDLKRTATNQITLQVYFFVGTGIFTNA